MGAPREVSWRKRREKGARVCKETGAGCSRAGALSSSHSRAAGEHRARTELASESRQHRASWQQGNSPVPDRTQGRVLRAGLSHPDVLQQLACLSCEGSKLEHLCRCPFHPHKQQLDQREGRAPLMESGPRAPQLPAPPPGGNDLQKNTIERCLNNFY